MMTENTFLWSCVWQSTVCVLAGLALSFALRRWPARAHRVLLLSIMAAVVVPLMSAGVKHMEWGLLVAEPEIVQPQVEQAGAAELVSNYELAESAAPVEILKFDSEPVAASNKAQVTIPWGQVFLWIWITAGVVLIGRVVVTLVLGIRLLARSVPLKCAETELVLLAAKKKLGVMRRVLLYCSEKVRSPVIWCWCREPILLLPSGSGRKDEAIDWESVFCHELGHWKRWDHLSGMLAEIVVCVCPWNPVFWLAKRRLVGLSEQACDDWVVSCGQRSTDYADSLLGMACQRQMAFAPAVVSSKKGLGGRIRRILEDRCGNPRTGVRWAMAITFVAVTCASVLAFAQSRSTESHTQCAGNATEARRVAPVVPVVRLDALPEGWRLDYDEGIRTWRGGMAKNLLELKIVPTPANEYDESWKEERIDFEILSQQGKSIGSISIRGNTENAYIILSPNRYRLLYKRGSIDPESNCTFPLNHVESPLDLNSPGMYQLRFSPKLELPKAPGAGQYSQTTCTGRIVDGNGDVVGGCLVAAYEMVFNMAGGLNLRLVGKAVTKADGKFFFKTTPSVKKSRSMGGVVVAQKEGLAIGWAEWPLYGDQQATITLGRPMKLSGAVVDENGEGISNAEIRVVLFEKNASEKEKVKWLPGIGPLPWLTVRTDLNGRFEFRNIPENVRADFVVSATGFGTIYTHKPENLSKGYEGGVFDPGQTDIKITLLPEARIEGKIIDKETGASVAGATVAVVPHFSPFFFERFLCSSKEDGTFSIGGLRSGEYRIRNRGEGAVSQNVLVESGKTKKNIIVQWPHIVLPSRPGETEKAATGVSGGLVELYWFSVNRTNPLHS